MKIEHERRSFNDQASVSGAAAPGLVCFVIDSQATAGFGRVGLLLRQKTGGRLGPAQPHVLRREGACRLGGRETVRETADQTITAT